MKALTEINLRRALSSAMKPHVRHRDKGYGTLHALCRRAAGLPGLACSVHVSAVVDTYDVDRPGGLVDTVDHPVRAAPRRVVPG